jgi:hypothetical protein
MFRNLILLLCVAVFSACAITYVIRRDWSDEAARAEAGRDYTSGKMKVLCADVGVYGGPVGLDGEQQKLVKKLPKQWFFRNRNSEYPYKPEATRFAGQYNRELCRLLSTTNAPNQ